MTTAAATNLCPVCRKAHTRHLISVERRIYHRCDRCEATYLEPAQRLSCAEEAAHYALHRNEPDDPRYRKFLSKLVHPLLEHLAPWSCGLDLGCGPGPALAHMLIEAGHTVALYDPFFFPDRAPLDTTYDFLTCSEVVEHLHDPAGTFDLMQRLVRPGGLIAIMTCFQTDDEKFARWHYRADPTHVVFYRARTFERIAADRSWHATCPIKDVVLFRTPRPACDRAEPQTGGPS